MRTLNLWGVVFLFVVLGSCSTKGIKQKGKLLAKVGETELYDSDLNIRISDTNDLKTIKERLVKEWVNRQLLFKKAISGLSDKEKDKDRQLKDYYESLIIFDYLNKMTGSNVDTSVSEKEMMQYYLENQKNFVTKRNIARLIYVKVPEKVKVGEKVRNWIRYPNRVSINDLKIFSMQSAVAASLDTEKWFYMDEAIKDIPMLKDNISGHFDKKGVIPEMKDGKYNYDINIVEYKAVGETSPFELVQTKIRQIILNRRKTQMIKNAENLIYREGDSKHLFDIFDNKIKKQ